MKRSSVKYLTGVAITLVVVVTAALLYGAPNALRLFRRTDNVAVQREVRSSEVLNSFYHCYDSEKRNTCFKRIASDFVARDGLGTVFAVIEKNEQTPKMFESCHVFLHFLGQSAYEKYKSVPEAFAHGNYACFAGFYHGVLEGYFIENNLLLQHGSTVDALKEKIPQICADARASAVKKDYNECLHGLGHGLMFATNGELPQALALCDALDPSEAGWCYSGVFMENATSTTNPDHPSKYLKKSDPLYPCDVLDEKYRNTCYVLQSTYFAALTGGNWAENIHLCMQVPAEQRGACLNGFGQNLVGYSTDPKMVKKNCLLVSSSYRNSCIAGAVGALGEKYKNPFPVVSSLCAILEAGDKETCYTTIFNTMTNWTADKKELEDFCSGINEVALKKTCIRRL